MLRNALLVFALCLLAVGLGTSLGGARETFPLAIWGAVLVTAVLVERWRYRPGSHAGPRANDSAWQRTDERFVDPESGQAMQVFYNPRTGERRYEPAPPDGGRPAA